MTAITVTTGDDSGAEQRCDIQCLNAIDVSSAFWFGKMVFGSEKPRLLRHIPNSFFFFPDNWRFFVLFGKAHDSLPGFRVSEESSNIRLVSYWLLVALRVKSHLFSGHQDKIRTSYRVQWIVRNAQEKFP